MGFNGQVDDQLSKLEHHAAVSLGTDTDGTIVSPSGHNNIVGIKPTVAT
jgi:Asp-tRNA(Asn)/Glu-tRNA(Gln) amidotransferase A subunit family amidase